MFLSLRQRPRAAAGGGLHPRRADLAGAADGRGPGGPLLEAGPGQDPAPSALPLTQVRDARQLRTLQAPHLPDGLHGTLSALQRGNLYIAQVGGAGKHVSGIGLPPLGIGISLSSLFYVRCTTSSSTMRSWIWPSTGTLWWPPLGRSWRSSTPAISLRGELIAAPLLGDHYPRHNPSLPPDRFHISFCYPCPGIDPNPIALGDRWMAYADQRLLPIHR